MKEITREDWVKNPTPRMMWVWDEFKCQKEQRLVVYCLTCKNTKYKFVTEDEDGRGVSYWVHCAEITEEEPKRMTNRGLSWWLRENPEEHREWKNREGHLVLHEYTYHVKAENEPCPEDIVIRVDGGEWHEPLVEVEE